VRLAQKSVGDNRNDTFRNHPLERHVRGHLADVTRSIHDDDQVIAVGSRLQGRERDAEARSGTGDDEGITAGRLDGLDEVRGVPRADFTLARDVLRVVVGFQRLCQFFDQRAVQASFLMMAGYHAGFTT